MPGKPDLAYSAIGALLSEDDLKQLLKRAAGIELSDIVWENDTNKKKVEKVIEYLKNRGNERWLLTRVLLYAPTEDQVRKKIVDAFPETLIRLPKADSFVTNAIGYLQTLLSLPLSRDLKHRLLPTRRNFEKMPQSFATLLAFKDLQHLFLRLLFALSANEAILAQQAGGLAPDLNDIANQIDQAVLQSAALLTRLGPGTSLDKDDLEKLTQFAVSLRSAPMERASDLIDDVQRKVRKDLSTVNSEIFRAVQDLSFDALTDDLPSRIEAIQDRQEYRELVQKIRDVAAIVLARALKSKLWQDAENDISLIRSYFILPQNSTDIADDWFSVRDRIDWLAQLEPDEQWASEARKYAVEIEDELFQEKNLDDVRSQFMAYWSWFRGPLLKIDDTTKLEFGSLNQLDGPFRNILKDLAP
jgi:hypothetical protein